MAEAKKKEGDAKLVPPTEVSKEEEAERNLEPLADPEGQRSNRFGGTIQSEPTAEELPPDAKIAPIAEQLNPNGAAQAVGAIETPDEGKKTLTEDMSDADEFLPKDSKQHEDADQANEDAERRAKRAMAATPPRHDNLAPAKT